MADQQPSIPPASGFTSIGNELDPTAPLWRVYRDEVRHHDQTVTFDEWNKTLDILLIFAGLFSAVVTSFLVASYPLLSPADENETVVNAIHALAKAINSSIALPTPKPPEPLTASILWVNGLWLASLFIALAVAFFAILAKQWLVEYNHRMADPPSAVGSQPTHLDAISPTASLAWARRRQFFFTAFADWHIPVLITQVLPFLLHVALFLFLVGLSVFVWTLNSRIARVVCALTALLFILYLVATVLPVLRAECPTATPLVRRAREAPTWVAIKALQLWTTIAHITLSAFGLSLIASRDMDITIADLRTRQKRIRDSGWLESAGTTDDEVKHDTLQWLILVSGSETAITAAFQSLGALPVESPFLPALRMITAGMDTAVEHLANSLAPATAVEIIRAVRSELILGRGSWDLPLLGLDLSSLFTRTLGDSQHPDARLLSAAMHLDATLYQDVRNTQQRSFSSLYDIIDGFLKGNDSSDSCISTVRLLINCPGIPVAAFACLSVFLASRSLQPDDSDKSLILRTFNRLRPGEPACRVYLRPHMCDGLCIASFTVCKLDLQDPAGPRIVPIVLSYLLPFLKPKLKGGDEWLLPPSMYRNAELPWAIIGGDWLHSPRPARNTDVEVLSTLMSKFDWSYEADGGAYLRILEWFMFRQQYRILRSSSMIAKVEDTLTCQPKELPLMLLDLYRIVHQIRPNYAEPPTHAEDQHLNAFIASLILLCKNMLADSYKELPDILFNSSLVPQIGACLERMGGREEYAFLNFFSMVDAALGSLSRHVEDNEGYLLHLAQHCVALDTAWTLHAKVGAQLDARRVEELLVQKGPCTKCTEGSMDKWPDYVLDVLRARTPTVEQSPQPGPSALPPRDAPSTLLDPSAPAILLTTSAPPDVALSSSDTATPNAISVLRIESTPMPILQAPTRSGPVSLSFESKPVLATLSISPGYAVLMSALDSTPAVAAPSDTTPAVVIVPSLAATATQHLATAPTHIRAHEVPPGYMSPAEPDDIESRRVSPSRIVSQPGTTSRGDEASAAHVAQGSPSEIASSVGESHDYRVIRLPRTRQASAVSSPADRAVHRSSSPDAERSLSSKSETALDVPAVSAATDSRSVLESSATTPPPAALSQAHVYTTSTSPSDSSEHIPDVDVAAGSSTA